MQRVNDNKKISLIDNITGRFTNNQGMVLTVVVQGKELNKTIIKSLIKKYPNKKWNRSNVLRTLSKLEERGLVVRENKSHYPTQLGVRVSINFQESLLTTKSSSGLLTDNKKHAKNNMPYFRAEKIGLKQRILAKPKDWGYNRRKIFKEKNLKKIKTKQMKNWEEVSFRYDEILIKTSNTHLIYTFPEKYYYDNIEECEIELMQTAFELKNRIERKLNIDLSNEIEFIGVEIAEVRSLMTSELADEFEEHENYIAWKDPKTNKIRLKIDKSPGKWEIEYPNTEWGFDDAKEILKRRADEVTHPQMPLASDMAVEVESNSSRLDDTESKLDKITENQLRFSQSQLLYAENIKSHVGAIKTLDKSSRIQTENIERQTRILERLEKKLDL